MKTIDTWDQKDCEYFLAGELSRGTLSLVIGTGVSLSTEMGIPDWEEIITRLVKNTKFDASDVPNPSDLLKMAEFISIHCSENSLNFIDEVRISLYQNLQSVTTNFNLLHALGALVIGSTRGSAGAVINYNFDDILETYLDLYGFNVQITSKYPSLVSNNFDITIYHPHGFLPRHEGRFRDYENTDIVFDQTSYSYLWSDKNPWSTFFKHSFVSNTLFFVGFSGEDLGASTFLTNAFDAIGKERPLGVIMVSEIDSHSRKLFLKQGLVPMVVGNYSAMPSSVLSICRSARDF